MRKADASASNQPAIVVTADKKFYRPGDTILLSAAVFDEAANQTGHYQITAMEDLTQVDSTSLDIQVLHDPFEQQNPFPNHGLLAAIAKHSGGQVIHDSTQLAEVLRGVPLKAGTPVVKKTPLWSHWWLWSWLLGLLTVEWIWRRVVGLA